MEKFYTIDLSDDMKFSAYMEFDNVEAVTLCPREGFDDLTKFCEYAKARGVDYYLCKEQAGKIHYHGLISYPNALVRKRLQVWFNNNYGKYHKSDKGNSHESNKRWHKYCHKNVTEDPEPVCEKHPQYNMNASIFED